MVPKVVTITNYEILLKLFFESHEAILKKNSQILVRAIWDSSSKHIGHASLCISVLGYSQKSEWIIPHTLFIGR